MLFSDVTLLTLARTIPVITPAGTDVREAAVITVTKHKQYEIKKL